MKRTLLFAIVVLLAVPASAQYLTGTTAPGTSSFMIGPRYSNYSTDLDAGLLTLETGRQHSIGLLGEYRAGAFVLDFMMDHDPENGLSVTDLIVDTGDYSRDRLEGTVGFAVLPFLDLQLGGRSEELTVGGARIFGSPVFTDFQFEHQAIVFGAEAHSTSMRPFGIYGSARGYIGSADFEDEFGAGAQSDTTGYRLEGGFAIPIGESAWTVMPAIEVERIETEDFGISISSNRLLLNFVYSFRR